MSRYKFRLQSVLRLRQRKRDQATESYQQALLAIQKLETEIEQLQREHASQNPLRIDSCRGSVDPQRILESQRYQMHLQQQVDHLRSQTKLVAQEAERRRLNLVECEKQVRIMENLEKRQLEAWTAEAQKKEQIALDQWAGFRYWELGESTKQDGDDFHTTSTPD